MGKLRRYRKPETLLRAWMYQWGNKCYEWPICLHTTYILSKILDSVEKEGFKWGTIDGNIVIIETNKARWTIDMPMSYTLDRYRLYIRPPQITRTEKTQ